MVAIDVSAIEEQARKEISKEITDTAVTKLKELYGKREKALLVVRNIDREIEAYKADIVDSAIYKNAGVTTPEK